MPIFDQAETATNQDTVSPQRALRSYRSYVQQHRVPFILGGLGLIMIAALAAVVAWPRESVQSMHVAAAECGDWTIYSGLDPGPFASLRTLGPIAAVNPDDLWILGSAQIYPGAREERAIMFHWDGDKFTSVQGPADATAYEVIFNDVSVLNRQNVWAVGSAGLDSVNRRFLLVHWDGVQWERVEVPWTSNGDTDVLTGVAALSTDNIWTVGWTATYPETHDSAVIQHWDGTQWTLVPSADLNFGEEDVSLSAIKAISGDNIWVVGQIGVKNAHQTLAIHWDGTGPCVKLCVIREGPGYPADPVQKAWLSCSAAGT
jgi:hypothetical protein